MLRKFGEGLLFGTGFGISFLAISYIAAYFLMPILYSSGTEQTTSMPSPPKIEEEYPLSFHELSVEERIKKSSVIALAKYAPADDGEMKAILTEFLKRDPDVTFYYDIGDEHPQSSYYPEENTRYGDGLVIFFTGSPATMKSSVTFHGDRISALGDIPLELFKEKCDENNT